MLEFVIQEVLWSIRGSYSAIWSFPLTNVKWHSDPWPTVTTQPIRLSTNFMTFLPTLTFTELRVVSMDHLQRGTLTLPDTWFRPPFWDLLMLRLLRPNSSKLPCLYFTFHLEYPLILSRFCFDCNVLYLILKVHSWAQSWYLSVLKCDCRGVVHSSIWGPYIPKCAYGALKTCYYAETLWPRQSSENAFA